LWSAKKLIFVDKKFEDSALLVRFNSHLKFPKESSFSQKELSLTIPTELPSLDDEI
jgi:hypothetical protein